MTLQDDFRDTLAGWPSGVSVVTTQAVDQLHGLTVSSFTSVSLEPPLILVCLAAPELVEALQTAARFAVSLLGRGQEAVSTYFASSDLRELKTFKEVGGTWTPSGLPVIDGAVGQLECKLFDARQVGDHAVVVGEVEKATRRPGIAPLVYWDRAYRGVD